MIAIRCSFLVIETIMLSGFEQGLLIGGGVSVLVCILSIVFSRRGYSELRQRILALVTRIDSDGQAVAPDIEQAVSRLELSIDRAATAIAEISESEIRVRRTLDLLNVGVIIYDENGQSTFMNKAALDLGSQASGEGIVAKSIKELCELTFAKGQPQDATIELFGPPRRSLSLRSFIVDDGQRSLGATIVVEDMTEKKRLEEVRKDFVANVSHELKTPMAALGLLAETLGEETDLEIIKKLVNRIHLESFRASRIIDDLLDLSRIEAEESPKRDPLSIDLILAEAVEHLKQLAEKKQIVFDVQESEKDLLVYGDRRQLLSAVENVIENAIKYSQDNSKVFVKTYWEDNLAVIEVKDEGIGIPAKDLDRIFERFYRVDHAHSRSTGGTGLGLSIVRHVVQNHKGSVNVESLEGVGSTFRIKLPLIENPFSDSAKEVQ